MRANPFATSLFTVKKETLVICIITALLTSCIGPKKINNWVARQYDEVPTAPKKKSDYITITSNLASTDDKISTTEKNTSHVLPLIVYWQWDYKNTCTLNPQIPVNNFKKTVSSYANKGLKQKLNGQRIELTIEKIPNTFALDDYGHVVWVIYAFTWEKVSIQPSKNDLVVSYKVIKDDNTITKSGLISVANRDKGVTLEMFQSLKKRTWVYLSDYDDNITSMSKSVVDKISAEL